MEEQKKSREQILEEQVEELKKENEQLKKKELCMRIGGEKRMLRTANWRRMSNPFLQ